MLIVLLMGFAAGVPYYFVNSTLQAWLTDAQIDMTTIGILSGVSFPYTFKFLWAPLLDRYVPGFLGRRRGWIALSQIGMIALFAVFSTLDPSSMLPTVGMIAVGIAFLSATQDIVIDAYRREFLANLELGIGNSMYVAGYRIAMLFASVFPLFLADHMPWSVVFFVLAGGMAASFVVTLIAPEPKAVVQSQQTLAESFWLPLKEYFSRPSALWILAFIICYKLGDTIASTYFTPFYLREMGFTKSEIAGVGKIVGFWAVLLGGFLGGASILRFGMLRCLFWFGVLQAVSTLGFVFLHHAGPSIGALTAVVAFENVTGGMGTAAFMAFMAAITDKRFTATQLALLTSLMGIPRQIAIGGGWFTDQFGWDAFFTTSTLIAIPGLLLIIKIRSILKQIDLESQTPPVEPASGATSGA